MKQTVIEGYRTRIRAGQAERYRRTHARIPDRIAEALIECGLVSWRIWMDGDVLFHAIETTSGREELVRRMSERGSIDPDWDELIGTMVDDAPRSSASLDLVWSLARSE